MARYQQGRQCWNNSPEQVLWHKYQWCSCTLCSLQIFSEFDWIRGTWVAPRDSTEGSEMCYRYIRRVDTHWYLKYPLDTWFSEKNVVLTNARLSCCWTLPTSFKFATWTASVIGNSISVITTKFRNHISGEKYQSSVPRILESPQMANGVTHAKK